MPTLPLYVPDPGDPDASHHVTAPGGYEWWSFDAQSDSGDVHFVARFYDGFAFHPDFLRRYARYRRRPTRHVPPVPADYPRVEFALCERGQPARAVARDFPAGSFTAAGREPGAKLGPNLFRREGGSIRLRLDDAALSADLDFRPLLPHRPHERALLRRGPTGAEHFWVLSDALCAVEGSIRVDGGARTIAFAGRGYRDHHFGTAPWGTTFDRWIRGRAFVGESVYAFHHEVVRGRTEVRATTLVRADIAEVRELQAEGPTVVARKGRGAVGAFPEALHFVKSGLSLANPRELDAISSGCLVVYDAIADGGAARGTALCEVGPYRPGVK
jgi:hypothetical protein